MRRFSALFVVIMVVAFRGEREVAAQTPSLPAMPAPSIAPAPRPSASDDDESVAMSEPVWDAKELQRRIVYPEPARRQNIQGRVILRVLVDKNGKVLKHVVDKSSGSVLLDKAAVDAVVGLPITPARINGMPIAVWVAIPVDFRLDDPKSNRPTR